MDLTVLGLSNAMAALGITVVVPVLSALPDIYGVDQTSAMWVMTAFMITYVSLMPIFGKLADLFGLKKIFIVANSIFALGLLIGFMAPNFTTLVLGRMVQGIGSGGILPVANAYAVETSKEGKEKRLAIVNVTYGIGMILGVNLGGIIYQRFGWDQLFFIPMVISVVLTLLCALYLKDLGVKAQRVRVDVLGSALFAISMILFILGMKYLTGDSNLGATLLVSSVLSFVSFVAVEFRIDDPAIDVKEFSKGRNNLSAILFGLSMFVTVTFMAPFVQLLLGYDVENSVYVMDPFAFSMAFSIALGGMLSRKLGLERVILAGVIALSASAFLFSRYAVNTVSYYTLSILLGFNLGFPMSPMTQIVIESVGVKKRGMASGTVSIMRSVGGVIGPTIASFVISKTDFSSLFALENLLDSYRKVFSMAGYSALVFSVLALIGFLTRKNARKEGYYAEKV